MQNKYSHTEYLAYFVLPPLFLNHFSISFNQNRKKCIEKNQLSPANLVGEFG